MSKPRLFLIALYAAQSDPTWRAGDTEERGRVHAFPPGPTQQAAFVLSAQGIVADSEGEAREVGMQLALETWPAEDGWVNHSVAANTVSPEMFSRIVKDVS